MSVLSHRCDNWPRGRSVKKVVFMLVTVSEDCTSHNKEGKPEGPHLWQWKPVTGGHRARIKSTLGTRIGYNL